MRAQGGERAHAPTRRTHQHPVPDAAPEHPQQRQCPPCPAPLPPWGTPCQGLSSTDVRAGELHSRAQAQKTLLSASPVTQLPEAILAFVEPRTISPALRQPLSPDTPNPRHGPCCFPAAHIPACLHPSLYLALWGPPIFLCVSSRLTAQPSAPPAGRTPPSGFLSPTVPLMLSSLQHVRVFPAPEGTSLDSEPLHGLFPPAKMLSPSSFCPNVTSSRRPPANPHPWLETLNLPCGTQGSPDTPFPPPGMNYFIRSVLFTQLGASWALATSFDLLLASCETLDKSPNLSKAQPPCLYSGPADPGRASRSLQRAWGLMAIRFLLRFLLPNTSQQRQSHLDQHK